jgi:hypothetical protein
MKAAECVSAAEKISDRAERVALLRVARSYLLASGVAEQSDQDSAAPHPQVDLPESDRHSGLEKKPVQSASRSSQPGRSSRKSRQPDSRQCGVFWMKIGDGSATGPRADPWTANIPRAVPCLRGCVKCLIGMKKWR